MFLAQHRSLRWIATMSSIRTPASLLLAVSLLGGGVSGDVAQAQGVYDIFAGGRTEGCESDATPEFTSHLTDLERIEYIVPWGTVQNGNLKNHSYLHIRGGGGNVGVAVHAPVDSHLIAAARYRERGSGSDEYMLLFQVSCEVAYKLDHIDTLSPKLAAALGDLESKRDDTRTTRVRPTVPLAAGDVIGYTNGTRQAGSWDFGVYSLVAANQLPDRLKTHTKRPEGSQYRYAVCPFAFFPEGIRQTYLALMRGSSCGP